MEEKTKGILLSGVNYGENDKIISVFTLEKGIISAKIKGVKKAGAKLKFASEPFCFAEYLFSKNQSKRTVIGASLVDSFYPIRNDIKKLYSAFAAIEFVKNFFKEEIIAQELFLELVSALKDLAYSKKTERCVLLSFIIKALKYSGYALNLSGCACCEKSIENRAFFNAETGSFYCEKCFNSNGREIDVNTLNALIKIFNGQEIEDKDCVRPLKLIHFYVTTITEENFPSLKFLIELG